MGGNVVPDFQQSTHALSVGQMTMSYTATISRKLIERTEGEPEHLVTGLFFEYAAVVSASINIDDEDSGWCCMIEVVGENYETKREEVIGIAVNRSFDTAKDAVKYGVKLVRALGVECLDTREEEL